MSSAAVRAPGGEARRRPGPGPAPIVVVAAALLALAALLIAVHSGVKGVAGVPDALRGVAGGAVLFAVAGYAPARVLLARELMPHFLLFVLPVGAAVAALGLTVLGFVGVPPSAALALLLAAGLVGGVVARLRLGPARAEPAEGDDRWMSVRWPAYLALLLIALCLIPVFRAGYGSVPGNNPDGMLSVGAAEFLQHSGPRDLNPPLPVDRMPPVWRSKYPIYYGLAGGSTLSGLDPVVAYTGFAALLAAMAAVGYFLLTRHGLGAGPYAALLAMALVALDRVIAYVALHPYFNQLWGAMALPFILLFGLRFLDRPNRRDGVLALLFTALGLTAYPLMVVFPALAFVAAVVSLRRRGHGGWIKDLNLPRGRRSLLLWVPLGIVLVPATLIVALGVLEKTGSAANLLIGGKSLKPWSGDLAHFPDPGQYIGPPGVAGYVLGVAAVVAAVMGLRMSPRTPRAALGAVIAGGLALGLYFRLRTHGEYFDFKVLAFLGPLLLVCAAPWLVDRMTTPGVVARRVAVVCVAAVLALQVIGMRDELSKLALQVDRNTSVLRDVARDLPPGSIRLDVKPDGRQLWAAYYLSERPLSSVVPILYTTYPHVPYGRRARYLLADRRTKVRPWPDADGAPLWQNEYYRLYRMKPGVPGPDNSSRTMDDDFRPGFD